MEGIWIVAIVVYMSVSSGSTTSVTIPMRSMEACRTMFAEIAPKTDTGVVTLASFTCVDQETGKTMWSQ